MNPDTRRVILSEIAHQRAERDGYRRVADDEAESYGVQLKARLRADGCERAIRALIDVMAEIEGAERRHAADEMAVPG